MNSANTGDSKREPVIDQKLRRIVSEAFEQELQSSEFKDSTFAVIWNRANQVRVKKNQKQSPQIWIKKALIPALSLAAIALLMRFQHGDKMGTPVRDQRPTFSQTKLVLPTDGLLKAAQKSYVMAQIHFSQPKMNSMKPDYPTDSLKWRTQ